MATDAQRTAINADFDAREKRAAAMYGKPGSENLTQALSSYFDRRRSSLSFRNDREGMATADAERAQLESFARARGMSNEDLHRALRVMSDHENQARSSEALEARRSITFQRGCETAGGEGSYRQTLTRAASFQDELAKAVPTLAQRALKTGAAQDADLIDVCAKYAPNTQEST